MEGISSDLVFIIMCFFQKNSDYTDVKTLINLAEVNKFFYDAVKNSEFSKIIWINYYNSLLPKQIKDESIHIGPQNWLKCSNQLLLNNGYKMTYPGMKSIMTEISLTKAKCWNPNHYINTTDKKMINWTSETLFKKIALRNFVLLKNEGPDFSKAHEKRLEILYSQRNGIQFEIKKLEDRKRISKLQLDEIFKDVITKKQAKSYLAHKNKLLRINDPSSPSQFFTETQIYSDDSGSDSDT